MFAGFIDDPTLNTALQDLRASNDHLKAYWNSIVTAANAKAYLTILTALQNRGWRYDVVNQWDRGVEFQRSIGIWYAIQEVASLAPDKYSHVALTALDRREELKTTNLTINGVWQDPTEIYGQPQTGVENQSGMDEYVTRQVI